MRIRAAATSDARAIASVHIRAWRATYHGSIPDSVLDNLDLEQRSSQWANWLSLPDRDTFVLELDSIIGFCNLAPTRDTDASPMEVCEITAIYVDPDHWRQGYGKALLNAALLRARERRFSQLTLWVLRENNGARSFYEALRFHHDGTERVDTQLVGSPLHEVRYRLSLGPRAA